MHRAYPGLAWLQSVSTWLLRQHYFITCCWGINADMLWHGLPAGANLTVLKCAVNDSAIIRLLSLPYNMSNCQANALSTFDIGVCEPLFCPLFTIDLFSSRLVDWPRFPELCPVCWGVSRHLNRLGQQRTQSLMSLIWTRAYLSQAGKRNGDGGTWFWVPWYYPREYTNLPLDECHAIGIQATDNSLPRERQVC